MFNAKARSVAFAMLAGAAITGATVAAAPTADAATTKCPSGYVCLFFNSNYQGAQFNLKASDGYLGDELFKAGAGGSNGAGVQVGNNAASVINKTGKYVVFHDHMHCKAGHAWETNNKRLNLASVGLKNQVSSVTVGAKSAAPPACANR